MDYFGLFKMFILILGASIAIIHLKDMKDDPIANLLIKGCGCVIILIFIATAAYLHIEI